MKKLILLFVVSLFLSITTTKANHYAGVDLSYTSLGNNSYLITYVWYRNCHGNEAPTQVPFSFESSTDTSLNFTNTLQRIPGTGSEITPHCPSSITKCTNGYAFAVESYTYQATVTLVPSNWVISIDFCCRDNLTTVSVNDHRFYIEVELNNIDAPGNNSPVFTSSPLHITLNNQSVTYNHGAIDPDGDSLAYSFCTQYTSSPSDTITYYPPYHSQNFLSSSTPIHIDPQSGAISFHPTLTLSTTTAVKVEEYRKINGIYTKIGTVYRNMELRVFDGSMDNYPVLSGINKSDSKTYNPNDTDYNATFYLGDTVRFTLNGFDADTFNSSVNGNPEKFSINYSNSIPGATIQTFYNGTDSAYLSFYWVPTQVDKTSVPNYLFIEIQDEACTYNGKQIYTYGIHIDSTPPVGIQTSKLPNQNSLMVYPNPSQGLFNVSCEGISNGNYNMEVLNTIGEVIYSKSEQINQSKSELQIDLSAYPKGVYILRFSNAEQEYRSKLLVQ